MTDPPITEDQLDDMPASQYIECFNALMAAVQLINTAPIRAMRGHLAKVEILGPLLEPTAYMRGGMRNLRDQGELLAALAEVQRVSLVIAERSKPN